MFEGIAKLIELFLPSFEAGKDLIDKYRAKVKTLRLKVFIPGVLIKSLLGGLINDLVQYGGGQ